jgi:hypothetical protein
MGNREIIRDIGGKASWKETTGWCRWVDNIKIYLRGMGWGGIY